MKSKKTAIIIHGGAIKAAFAAGVVYALSQAGVETADIILGTSSSVPTTAYFASKQFNFIKEIWKNEIGTKKFIRYKNLLTGKPIFDLDYLIHSVFRKKYPLNVRKIVSSESRFLIPLYNYVDGKVELRSSQQKDFKRDFWRILQAAITIHDHYLAHDPKFHKFVDADLDPFALYRQHVIPKSYNVLVVFNHKDLRVDLKKFVGLKIFELLQSKNFPSGVKRKLYMRNELITSGLQRFSEFEKRYQPLLISPPSTVNFNFMSVVARNDRWLRTFLSQAKKQSKTWS